MMAIKTVLWRGKSNFSRDVIITLIYFGYLVIHTSEPPEFKIYLFEKRDINITTYLLRSVLSIMRYVRPELTKV
jgi:hypothetical protein